MRLTKDADGFLAGKQVATSFAIAFNLANRCVLTTLHTDLSPLWLMFFGLPVLGNEWPFSFKIFAVSRSSCDSSRFFTMLSLHKPNMKVRVKKFIFVFNNMSSALLFVFSRQFQDPRTSRLSVIDSITNTSGKSLLLWLPF